MKKRSLLLLVVLLSLALVIAGCGGNDAKPAAQNAKTVLKVGATPVPHAEILNVVKPLLAKEGIDLVIVEMNDYVRPNLAVADKELDANFFQHVPYLNKFISERNLQLAYTTKVHIEPMGIYSQKIKNLNDLSNGAQVGIPNDPTNGGRALSILAQAGLIKMKDGVGVKGTVKDVTDNPKKLVFKELEAPQLPRALADVDLALINTNYAIEAKLNPTKDALFIEGADSPYTNIVVARKDRANGADIAKLMSALHSADTKKFIQEKYKGAVVPAF